MFLIQFLIAGILDKNRVEIQKETIVAATVRVEADNSIRIVPPVAEVLATCNRNRFFVYSIGNLNFSREEKKRIRRETFLTIQRGADFNRRVVEACNTNQNFIEIKAFIKAECAKKSLGRENRFVIRKVTDTVNTIARVQCE